MNTLKPCHCCAGSGKELDHAQVGLQMRQGRLSKKLTLKTMAGALGLSVSYLSDLELGRRMWRTDLINLYHDALK